MAKLMKLGNSCGVLIPKGVLEAAQLHVGDELSCRLIDSGAILLTPRKGGMAVVNGYIEPSKPVKPKAVTVPEADWFKM